MSVARPLEWVQVMSVLKLGYEADEEAWFVIAVLACT